MTRIDNDLTQYSDFELFDEFTSFRKLEWQKEYVENIKNEIKKRYGSIKKFIKLNGFEVTK